MICAAGRGMSLRGCQPYTVRRSAEPMATRLKGGFLDGAVRLGSENPAPRLPPGSPRTV